MEGEGHIEGEGEERGWERMKGKKIKNKLGQRKSQTPFSSAFWVQKDFMSKKSFGFKSFLAPKSWVIKILSRKNLGIKIFFLTNKILGTTKFCVKKC